MSYYDDMYGPAGSAGNMYGGSGNSSGQGNPLGGSSDSGDGGFNWGNALKGGMMGGALSGIVGGLFGGDQKNPADAAMPYEQGALNRLPGYYQPYMNAGQQALGGLQGQYSNLLNDPSGMVNKIGAGYHQSPGFQFAMQQALQGANHASGAGGMAGSPMNQQQNMGVASGLANQDYGNYMQRALGMYGQGLQGEQGMAGLGYGAASGLGQNMSDIMNNQAQMAYSGQQQQNQNQGAAMGGLASGIGTIASMIPW